MNGFDDTLPKTCEYELGARLFEKKITDVVFDRSGFPYHGRIKALAEGAREGGLKF